MIGYNKFLQTQLNNRKKESLFIPDRNKKVLELITGLNLNRSINILDVGAASGNIALYLYKKGFKNIDLIDIVDQRSQNAKKFKLYIVDLISESKECIEAKFKNKKYNLVLFGDVLEHFTQPYEIIWKLSNIISNDGYIIISVPNSSFFLNFILLSFFPSKLFFSTSFGPWGHYFNFTFYSLKKMLQVLDFNVEHLGGGLIDDHVYKFKGFRGAVFRLFSLIFYPLSISIPSIFSDHIYCIAIKRKFGKDLKLEKIYEEFVK